MDDYNSKLDSSVAQALSNTKLSATKNRTQTEEAVSYNRRGQVAIYIIVAIVILGAILAVVLFRGEFQDVGGIPAELQPVYTNYLNCVEQELSNGIELAGSQGGRVGIGDYQEGSDFAPFSSHLNFVGLSIPYWYYISGNGLIKENVPTKSEMENELEGFLEVGVRNCDFDSFYEQGFEIELGDIERVNVDVLDGEVRAVVSNDVVVSRGDNSARKTVHEVSVDSKLGEFYNFAVNVYNKEKGEAFLEDYSEDVLRLYAPVDGVEIQCSPKIWRTQEVADELKSGLEGNIAALKLGAKTGQEDYFTVDYAPAEDRDVRFLYSRNWPSKFEVTPASNVLMMAEPVGTQEGLGILGFCYVPYHFVYDLSYPVLIQISDNFEIFQFPVVVVIDNNLPRQGGESSFVDTSLEDESDACNFVEDSALIRTFDVNLNPVEAEISYQCFDDVCPLGTTALDGGSASLDAFVPSCLNGQLIANAEGFAEKRILFSSNSETNADIILDREYEISVDVRVAGRGMREGETAVVHFTNEGGETVSALLPENTVVALSEGIYDVKVFVYGASSVKIPASRQIECYETVRGGIFGIFGGTKEKCVDIEIPETTIDFALAGGGKTNTYILESELQRGNVLVDASELPKPNSMEQLQYNYEVFESLGVNLEFGA